MTNMKHASIVIAATPTMLPIMTMLTVLVDSTKSKYISYCDNLSESLVYLL